MLYQHNSRCTLLTGATGFIGHRLLLELLRAGQRCVVTLREPVERSVAALTGLLSDFDFDVAGAIASGQLVPVACDLREGLPRLPGVQIDAAIHAAACTRFTADNAGDPAATNVEGTRKLLNWCDENGVRNFHLISSAYVCGRWGRRSDVPESFHDSRPDFHNDYEASKWEAEQLCRKWAAAGDAGDNRRRVSVYRPSVVVGEFATGRATKFDAFYIPVRATEILSRAFADPNDARRWAVPLRIKGRPGDWQDIVPVDYVASMIARLVQVPADEARECVYHLTSAAPPTNAQIKLALEENFRLRGGRFVEPSLLDCAALNEYERLFADISQSVEHYLIDTPRFARANAAAAAKRFGIECPTIDGNALRRLFRYAESVDWLDTRRRRSRGRDARSPEPKVGSCWPCATYFEHFLPARVNASKVARMTGLTVTIRFEIDDVPRGEWVCRFERGRLVQVLRTPAASGVHCDVGYRSTVAGFWKSISGRHHPQELFLGGHAQITGDVERALKMAMILNAFAREFPCDEQSLRAYANDTGIAASTRVCA